MSEDPGTEASLREMTEVLFLRKEQRQKALVERMRKAIAEKKSAVAPVRPVVFTLPPYDDIYFEGLRVMKEDEEY